MNKPLHPVLHASTCPHDCPSTCALEVEVLDQRTIGRVRGAGDNAYTAGVICAKVARYAERVHHADRLMHPRLTDGETSRNIIRNQQVHDRDCERCCMRPSLRRIPLTVLGKTEG